MIFIKRKHIIEGTVTLEIELVNDVCSNIEFEKLIRNIGYSEKGIPVSINYDYVEFSNATVYLPEDAN